MHPEPIWLSEALDQLACEQEQNIDFEHPYLSGCEDLISTIIEHIPNCTLCAFRFATMGHEEGQCPS